MKLYSEKQIKECLDDYFSFGNRAIDYALSKMTPIELPSDEKIIYRCFQEDSYELATDGDSALKTYTDGYRAALEQILNQNK